MPFCLWEQQNYQVNIYFHNKIGQNKLEMKQSGIKFDKKPIKNQKIYYLHKVEKDGNQYFAKVFNQSIIDKYNINQALEFNIEVLTESPNFFFPDNILHITHNLLQDDTSILLTKPYTHRLDQFIGYKPQNQKTAMGIFQDLLKGVYAIFMSGYWHRNLRAEHFVLSENKWKIQSIVYDQVVGSSGLNCEYLFNSEYQPPEAYEKPNFTEEELDQRIVWDLGCIMIHLLLGSHKLKNQQVLNKFKNQPFSFKKLGAQIGDKISPPLKQILGKMCHYNQDKRMSLSQLIQSGFFSKEVAQHYAKHKGEKKATIFVGSQSSMSVALSNRKDNQRVQFDGIQRASDNLLLQSKKAEDRLGEMKKPNLAPDNTFKKQIQSIIEQQQASLISFIKNESKLKQKQENPVHNQKVEGVLSIYKNFLDKAEILQIGGQRMQDMGNLFTDKELAKELILLTEYALNFVRAIEYCRLAKAMNENKQFFQFDKQSWLVFHGTPTYEATKKYVNYCRTKALESVQDLRKKLTINKNRFVLQKHKIQNFVNNLKPEQTTYLEIKEPYRRIVKISYDIIAKHYTENKIHEWAKLGMYITYCLAIDKMYIADEFQDNFKHFFIWADKKPSNYVSLYDFQNYLESAQRVDLVQHSKYILRKFFDI